MRREAFTIEIDLEADVPTLLVTFSGTATTLRRRLDDDGRAREASDLDVAYRETPGEDSDGVLGVTDRVTGDFIFEAPAGEVAIASLVTAAKERSGDEEPSYRLRIEPGDDDPLVARKRTLLVYDRDGKLNRGRSLIPAGVEM